MNHKTSLLFTILLLLTAIVTAQVQVSKEPRHKKVLENKYIRVLDVWMQPGDTSMFHIHSTPSVFLILSDTKTISQIKGAEWEKGKNVAGHTWYRSFINDTLIHRVGNADTVLFHVTDIELLSPYKPNEQIKALPFPLLYDNERVFAYQLTDSSLNDKMMSNRGPLIAEVVTGEVKYSDTIKGKSIVIKAGKYLYIEPGSSFYLTAVGNKKLILVLFEIK